MIFVSRRERDDLAQALLDEKAKRQAAEVRADKAERSLAKLKSSPTLYCSFCGKSHHEAAKMVCGPAPMVNICDECLVMGVGLLGEEILRSTISHALKSKPQA